MPSLKKTIAGVAIAATLAGGAAPLVPQDMKWLYSHQTAQFETADGDLAVDEYAAVEGGGFFIRELSKDEAPFFWTEATSTTEGKKEVAVKCYDCAFYDVFTDGKREYRVPSNGTEYHKLALKDSGQPEKAKFISTYEALFTPSIAEAAIAFNATTTQAQTSGTSWTFAHTIAGTNTFLVVETAQNDTSSTDMITTSRTYNAVGLTNRFVVCNNVLCSSANTRAEAWYLVAPTTGTNNVVVTNSGSVNVNRFQAMAISFTEVAQTNPIDNFATTTFASTVTFTQNLTIGTDQSWVVDVVAQNSANVNPTASSTQTIRHKDGGTALAASYSTVNGTTTGTQTNTWLFSAAAAGGMGMMSFKPFVAAAAANPAYPTIFIESD